MSSVSGSGNGGSGGVGIITITGNTGGALTGSNINFLGGTTGLVFNGASTTETLGGILVVANGGTGIATTTAYAPLVGGTTATGPFQSASTGIGTAGFVLTSTGASSVPTWQVLPAGGIVTLNGNSGSATGSTVSVLGGLVNAGASALFSGSGSTLQLSLGSGSGELFLGKASGTGLTGSRFFNAAVGDHAFAASGGGGANISGSSNAVLGPRAAGNTRSAAVVEIDSCVLIGDSVSGSANATSQTLLANVFIGGNSGGGSSTAATIDLERNVGVGAQSLSNSSLGTDNICLGYRSGVTYTTNESNNIIIGGGDVVGDSFVTRIGYIQQAGPQTSCFIEGIDGITVTGTAVLVATGGQLGVAVSSAKYKDNIQDMGDSSSRALNLRPVTFSYKGANEVRFGLIAEEVHEVLPEIVVYDKAGDPQTVMYHELPVLLLNELQKALKRIEALEAKGA